MSEHGKQFLAKDAAPTGSQGTLLTVFCDGAAERGIVSPAQQRATEECQHPRQPRPQPHEAFESYGRN